MLRFLLLKDGSVSRVEDCLKGGMAGNWKTSEGARDVLVRQSEKF